MIPAESNVLNWRDAPIFYRHTKIFDVLIQLKLPRAGTRIFMFQALINLTLFQVHQDTLVSIDLKLCCSTQVTLAKKLQAEEMGSARTKPGPAEWGHSITICLEEWGPRISGGSPAKQHLFSFSKHHIWFHIQTRGFTRFLHLFLRVLELIHSPRRKQIKHNSFHALHQSIDHMGPKNYSIMIHA